MSSGITFAVLETPRPPRPSVSLIGFSSSVVEKPNDPVTPLACTPFHRKLTITLANCYEPIVLLRGKNTCPFTKAPATAEP